MFLSATGRHHLSEKVARNWEGVSMSYAQRREIISGTAPTETANCDTWPDWESDLSTNCEKVGISTQFIVKAAKVIQLERALSTQ